MISSMKMYSWNLTESQYDEVNDLPLMTSPGPMLVILATYLLFVLKVGPAYMKDREPYKLKTVMLLYNVIQVIFSAIMVQRYFNQLTIMGVFPRYCHFNEDKTRSQVLVSIWIYFSAKVTELLDTVFFVLRKKDNQVTFLHLYHHSIMMIGTWALLKYWPSHSLIFIGFLNSLVHVLMYTYYGLASLGPNVAKYLTWKKYMTTFQLVQFISIIFQYVVSVCISECPPTKGVAVFIASNTFFFFLLFLNFYRQSYNLKKSKKQMVNGGNVTEKVCGEKICNDNHCDEKKCKVRKGKQIEINGNSVCNGIEFQEKPLNGLSCKEKVK